MQERQFQLVAGNVALDLVNTLDFRFRPSGPEDLLTSYEDLIEIMVQSKSLSKAHGGRLMRAAVLGGLGQRALAEVRELREALAGVMYALLDGGKAGRSDLAVLERVFHEAGLQRRLGVEAGRVGWNWKDGGDVRLPLWMLAWEAAELLVSEKIGLLRECNSDTCRWLFLDTSKNRTRRWCDMKICGNRMKARRYQARQH